MAVPTYLVELRGASSWLNITSYVQSVNITRGRSRELDKFEAGSFSITLNNRSRAFDPTYTFSPYYGYVVPRRRVRVSSAGVVIFTGYVADWNLSYDVSGESIAVATGNDAFIYLTNQLAPTLSNGSVLSGVRIAALITYLGVTWPGGTSSINDGLRLLQADTIPANTNLLDYLQLCERTERGFLFVSANNALTYYNYAGTGSPAPTQSSIIFSDASNIGYQNIDVVYGSELLYNTIVLSRLSGGTVTVTDSASVSAYGQSVYQDDGLLTDTDANLTNQALVIAGKFSTPEYRFDSVSVMLNPLSAGNQASVLGLELADTVKVVFTPNTVGSEISKYVRIIGIEHNMSIDQHVVTYKFTETDGDAFILDSNAFGQLDYNQLGY